MTQDQIAELREKLAKKIADARDSMVAEGDDIIWLFCQVVHWPHERVHPERTMSDSFIRVSAARTALALLDRIEKLEAAARECADKLTVLVIYGRHDESEREAARYAIAMVDRALLTKENPDARG